MSNDALRREKEDMKRPALLDSLVRILRSFFAGRRKSDAALPRLLRSSSDEPTVWKQMDPTLDSKTPLCPTCGATMIHAKGERSAKPEFWACSRLDCEGVREIEG